MPVAAAQTLIFPSKSLIPNGNFLLIWSSFCRIEALARLAAVGRGFSQQSYPQLL
jgi:hypothetical protein